MYQVALNNPSLSSFNFNNALFTSKLFSVNTSKLAPFTHKDLLGLAHLIDSKVLITQIISCDPKEAGNPPSFAVVCRHMTDLLVYPVAMTEEINLQLDLDDVDDIELFKEENFMYYE